MFQYVSNLKTIDLSSFDTSNVSFMTAMFAQCMKLEELDISNFNTCEVTSMANMFYSNYELKTIYVGDSWSTAKVNLSYNMFANSDKIKGSQGTTHNINHIDKTYARVDGGASAPGYLTFKSSK